MSDTSTHSSAADCPVCKRHRNALGMWAETVVVLDEENAHLRGRIEELEHQIAVGGDEADREAYRSLVQVSLTMIARQTAQLSGARKRIKELETLAGISPRRPSDR